MDGEPWEAMNETALPQHEALMASIKELDSCPLEWDPAGNLFWDT